jgi:hypothetical protein
VSPGVRFSSRANDFIVGAGSFYLGCIFVGVQVRFLFLRGVSGDDGFVRNVLVSSLRRGGSCESSRFCGALVPVVGRCAGGGGTGSRRSWRGSCRWVFSASDVTRWCRVAGSCGSFHAFGFLDDSGERLTMLVCIVMSGTSPGRQGSLQIGPLGSCLTVPFLSWGYVCGDVLHSKI